MKNGSRWRPAAMAAVCGSVFIAALPVCAEEFSGRVEKNNVHRLVRPSDQLISAPVIEGRISRPTFLGKASATGLSGRVDDRSFTLGVDKAAARSPLNADLWGAAGIVDVPQSGPWYSEQIAQMPPQAAGIDYDAIERAYANAVGAQGGSLNTTIGANGRPSFAGYGALFNRNILTGEVLGPTGAPLGAVAGVDTDNCACGMAIPSRSCGAERTSFIYGASYQNAGRGMAAGSSTPYASAVMRGHGMSRGGFR